MAKAILPTKRCNRCKALKSLAEFYRCSKWRDGLDYSCKRCRKAMNDASTARVRQTPEGLERLREKCQRWSKKKRRTDAAWRERQRAKARERYRANREEHIRAARARELRLKGVGGSHSCEAWRQMLDLFGHRCLCCGRTERITKDHIVPVSRGGTDDIRNLQPLCIWCNKSKFTRYRDYRTRDKVVLDKLNAVGRLLFNGRVAKRDAELLKKHEPASRYTGVYYQPKCERTAKVWRAKIQVDGRVIELGRYVTREEAAAAYNRAAKQYRGEDAYTNDL